jgi:hypothetical protein
VRVVRDENKLGRRVFGEYKENYMHGADTCGIHASGAGFAKMDPPRRRTDGLGRKVVVKTWFNVNNPNDSHCELYTFLVWIYSR